MALAENLRPFGSGQEFQRASFTGSAKEYFGIWIVNILLTIITLGIYSAWAKVRRNRYFYGNTVLLGHTFEYHAKGKQILIGRLIVFAFLIVTQILSAIFPPFAAVVGLIIVAVFPWLFVRSVRFNARVTSYRNVRFDFVGGVGGAFAVLFLSGFTIGISLGLLTPLVTRWYYRYLFDNLRYGDRRLSTEPRLGPIYGAFALAAMIVILGGLALAVCAHALMPAFDSYHPQQLTVGSFSTVYGAIFGIFIFYLIGALFYRAAVRNVIWSAATLDRKHRLRSDISRFRFVWISVSNVFITFATLGLMRPWAAVRMQRYVTEHTAIHVDGDIGVVFDQIRSTGGVISAEYLDVDGFDFGF